MSTTCFILSSWVGLFTTHKNLRPLLSNPLAISFICETENDPRLPKQRNTTLLLGCSSSHDKHCLFSVATSDFIQTKLFLTK
uniref:Uncharacterized protein n=1 Tax=Cajanus cajan TaxID=3821 RepID=A0A151SYM8_CAJCA|nr:hypothetical protein KK1_015350 [Cajanus cajan]